ncbi:MAG: protein kinase family protein [Paludibacteraceae bacterium]|nr:protein kinase family protein [Paludibacteraceae bacterium]
MFDSKVNSGFTQIEDINISAHFTEIELLHASTNGYSEVYRAKRWGKWHILKCLTKEARLQPTYQTLLEKEFAIAYSVNHPNAVHTLGFEYVEDLGQCIIQEYIDGANPQKLNRQQAIELCQLVSYLHHEGIIHRDIKPDNLLIAKATGKLYVLDFGLADRYDYTVLKGAAGTTDYAAPEQLQQGIINPLTDIYGIGVVLLQISPYKHIARRCMRIQPGRRYPSAEAIVRVLKRDWWKIGFEIIATLTLLAIGYWFHTQTLSTDSKIQAQQVIIDSLQSDRQQFEIKNRADSLQIDSLTQTIVTMQGTIGMMKDKMSNMQIQAHQVENEYIMNSNNLYPHRYSSDNPNSQRY